MNKELINKKERIVASTICSFFWWFIAHGFSFTNLFLSHDSLHEFVMLDTIEHKLELGRFCEPL